MITLQRDKRNEILEVGTDVGKGDPKAAIENWEFDPEDAEIHVGTDCREEFVERMGFAAVNDGIGT
jgi:hypothetical protein